MSRAAKNTSEINTDVIIVGGGLVGATMACALSEGGVGVVLVDRMDPAAAMEAGFDGRVSAIALGSQRLLAGVGLWQGLEEHAVAIEDIRVSDGDSPFFGNLTNHLIKFIASFVCQSRYLDSNDFSVTVRREPQTGR